MRNIRDLPRGGGAAAGRQMWFAIESDDGELHEFRLPLAHVDAFIAGLRTFEAEALALRARADAGGVGAPPRPAFLKVERFEAARGPDGALELTLGGEAAGGLRAAVPPARIKALLTTLVRALAPAPRAAASALPSVQPRQPV